MATDSIFEKLVSFVGKSLGMGALVASAGIGIWLVKSWGRSLSLALVAVRLSLDVIGSLPHGGAFHVVRVLIDAALMAYLLQPRVLNDLLLQ